MGWRRVMSGVVASSLMIATACGGDGGEPRVLTDGDSGSAIDIDAGAQFEVHLGSNASTGFAWEISAMTTPEIATLDSRNYIEPDTDLVGAAGTEVFVFSAGAKGAGVLRLEYIRRFDDPVVAQRVVEYIILVDGADWPPTGGQS